MVVEVPLTRVQPEYLFGFLLSFRAPFALGTCDATPQGIYSGYLLTRTSSRSLEARYWYTQVPGTFSTRSEPETEEASSTSVGHHLLLLLLYRFNHNAWIHTTLTTMSEPDMKNVKSSSEELEEDTTTPTPKEEAEPVKLTYKQIAMNNGMLFTVTDVPPVVTSMILGLQHYLTMLGATVLIPLLLCPAMGANGLQTAEVISSIFFVSGINTVSLSLRSTGICANNATLY